MNKIIIKTKKGFTILEAVIYFSMLAVLTVVVISSLMSLFKSYSVIKLQQDIDTSAIQIMDKLTRDIRDADDVVLLQSSFDIPEGVITLSVLTDNVNNTYKYYSTNGVVKLEKNGVYLGDLSQSSIIVNSFVARYINATSTKAIKIELNIQATPRYGTSTISKNFYTTVQLRN